MARQQRNRPAAPPAPPLDTRERLSRLGYLLFAITSLGTGLWLLVDPRGANEQLWLLQVDGGLSLPTAEPALRKLGATWFCLSLAFLWCLLSEDARRRIHPVLVLFLGLQAVVDIADMAARGIPAQDWVGEAPWSLLPPVLLVLLRLPWPRRRAGQPAAAEGRSERPSRPARTASQAVRPAVAAEPAGDGPLETGEVKWFDARKGFGFILRADGSEVFVHFRALRRDGERMPRAPRDGQPVRFRVVQGPKGPQAADVEVLGKPA